MREKIREERFFIIAAIPLALIIMLLTSAHAWGDGTTHFWTVYHMSNQVMGIDGEDEWKARSEDVALFERMSDESGLCVTEEMFSDFSFFCCDDSMVYMSTRPTHMTYYSILSYLPQVLGLSLGRALGLGAVMAFLVARIFILAVYVIFSYLAIRRTPIGKTVFMALSLMPFTLTIASSFSYDVMIYVVTLNFISCILSLRDRFRIKTVIELFVFVFLIGAIKGGGYLILLPLVFLLINMGGKNDCGLSDVGGNTFVKIGSCSRRGCVLIIIGVILTGLVSVCIFDIVIPAGQELFQLSKDDTGNFQAGSVLYHPFSYVVMVIHTYISNAIHAVLTFGMTKTGFMNIIIMMIVPLYSYFSDDYCLRRSDKVIMWITISAVMFLTPLMLLTRVPEIGETISGLRARYYLPMMPLLLMLIGSMKVWNKNAEKWGVKEGNMKKKLKMVCLSLCALINVVGIIRII